MGRASLPGSDHEIVTRTAPIGGVTVDVPFVLGSEFLIPEATKAAGYTVTCIKAGLVALPFAEGASWATQGLKVFWNPSTGKAEATDSATNVLVGTYDRAWSATHIVVDLPGNSLTAADGDIEAKANKADLASTANGKGASLIGLEDSGEAYGSTNVEAAFAEVAIDLQSKADSADIPTPDGITITEADGVWSATGGTPDAADVTLTSEFFEATNVADCLDEIAEAFGQVVDTVQPPVLDTYDNTTALPASPTVGDRYIAKVSANGWTANWIYECVAEEVVDPPTPAEWSSKEPPAGCLILDQKGAEPAIERVFDGTNWISVGTGDVSGAAEDPRTEDDLLAWDADGNVVSTGVQFDEVLKSGDVTPTTLKGAGGPGSDLFHIPILIPKTFVAADPATGNPDDVEVAAVNTLPFPFVVLRAEWEFTAGTDAGRTVALRTAAGGTLGDTIFTADASTAKGSWLVTGEPSPVVPGASVGLFLRRSHDAVAGTVVLVCAKANAPG